MKKILLLLVIISIMFGTYLVSGFIKKKIDPRQSAANFFLYFAAHILTIFVMASLAGLIIIHFKDFFFKQ